MSDPSEKLPLQILTADLVIPSPGVLIADGGIAMEHGRIVVVGPVEQLRKHYAGVAVRHFPGHVLCPGFINAHTHLELSYLQGKIPGPARFPDWVEALLAAAPDPQSAATILPAAARLGAKESIRVGVTTVGDITRWPGHSRPVLKDGPLRVVSFGEITALGKRRNTLASRLAVAADSADATEYLTVGLSPHAPYSVEGPILEQIVALAGSRHFPLAMHLAENAQEAEFLAALTGPLGRQWGLMQTLDLLDAHVPQFTGGPIRWARHYGLLDAPRSLGIPVVLAHVNYADAAELKVLAECGASVAWCPRTHAYFGHDRSGPHPWRQMAAQSINVCLATDSLASNPDLSPLREARYVLENQPDSSPAELFAMITTRPAAALGLADTIGRLAPGFSADALMLPLNISPGASSDRVHEALVRTAPEPSAVWVMGRQVLA